MTTPAPRAVDPVTGELLPVQPFLDFLRDHRDGEFHEEVSEGLHALVAAVQAVGKKGTLTIVLDVRPAGRSHNQVFLVDEVRVKAPEPEREQAILFVDRDGNLTRANPLQQELPGLRQVPERATTTPREIDGD